MKGTKYRVNVTGQEIIAMDQMYLPWINHEINHLTKLDPTNNTLTPPKYLLIFTIRISCIN